MSPLLQIDRKCMTSLWIPGSLWRLASQMASLVSNREKILYSELQEKQGSMFYVLSLIVSSDSYTLYHVAILIYFYWLRKSIVLWDVIN